MNPDNMPKNSQRDNHPARIKGVPPVGTRCLGQTAHADSDWYEGVIIAHVSDPEDGVMAIIDYGDDWAAGGEGAFRPLSSEEELAIEEMVRIYRTAPSVMYSESMRDVYRAIRAGKVPGLSATGGEAGRDQ